MREGVTAVLTLGALAVLTVAAAVASRQLSGLDARIAEVLQTKRHITMQTLTQEVTRANGDKTTVTTTKSDDETLDQFVARHDAAVAKLKITPP